VNEYQFNFAGAALAALPSGALWWRDGRLLVVSDLHLGKSGRVARIGGLMLPPYETADTLARLERDIDATGATAVICLGDSFDDPAASADLDSDTSDWIARLQAGREWIWVEGNHDPGALGLSGTYQREVSLNGLTLRHIAKPDAIGEVSGHYHPKARVGEVSRPCFLIDANRVLLPAYGTYTGGLRCWSEPLCSLMGAEALAVLTGERCIPVPMPRKEQA